MSIEEVRLPMFNQLALEAHNVQRPQVDSRAPQFIKHYVLSAEQSVLQSPEPGRRHKTGSAREEGSAGLAWEGRKGHLVY